MKHLDTGIQSKSLCFSFTPSELAKRLYFYPTWCGHYYCTNKYIIDRETYPPILIVYVCEGIFHFKYGGTSFDARKGDVVIIDCRQKHCYYADSDLEFLYIHIDGSNSHEITSHILSERGPLIMDENNSLIGQSLFQMTEFYKNGGHESMIESSMRCYQFFKFLLSPSNFMNDSQKPVDEAIQYIQNNINGSVSLGKLASIANLSVCYFSHLFKQKTGFSPIEYLTNARLERAKVLLLKTNISVNEIADETGYSSSCNLIKMFKKRTGLTPTEFRAVALGSAYSYNSARPYAN